MEANRKNGLIKVCLLLLPLISDHVKIYVWEVIAVQVFQTTEHMEVSKIKIKVSSQLIHHVAATRANKPLSILPNFTGIG